jgi:hypothetical protein
MAFNLVSARCWACGPTGSSNSGPLFFGEFTARPTGHISNSPVGAGCSGAAESAGSASSQTAQSAGSRTTGIRSCNGAMSAFASVVMLRPGPARRRMPLIKDLAGYQACLALKGGPNIGDVATASARALIGFRPALISFDQLGISAHCSRSKWRWPVSGWRRLTMAGWLSAKFQVGRKSCRGFVIRNIARTASGPRRLAKRPLEMAG